MAKNGSCRYELFVTDVIIDEFNRNRPRLEAVVTTSVLDRLRQLRRELREFAGEQHEHIWLEETRQHIPLVNAMAPQNFREIAELLQKGKSLASTDIEFSRVVRRGLDKKAPFSTDMNSVADALLIELYSTQLERARPEDIYGFVTSNYRDFSVPNGDRREPHPDIASLFDNMKFFYLYQVEGLHAMLINQFREDFLEEYEEVEFLIENDEPRTLAEIAEAEQEFFDKVWYVRSIVYKGEEEEDIPEQVRDTIREARAKREAKYGRDELWKAIGPGHEEAWEYGFISGKLSALRWVLGSEWDFLDT